MPTGGAVATAVAGLIMVVVGLLSNGYIFTVGIILIGVAVIVLAVEVDVLFSAPAKPVSRLLYTCPGCGGDVYTDQLACPKCGHALPDYGAAKAPGAN